MGRRLAPGHRAAVGPKGDRVLVASRDLDHVAEIRGNQGPAQAAVSPGEHLSVGPKPNHVAEGPGVHLDQVGGPGRDP